MIRTIKLVIDKDEKRPIKFPENFYRIADFFKVEIVRRKLRTGDYRLDNDGFAKVGIERKSSHGELYSITMGGDRGRFEKQLIRMRREYDHPILLVETLPNEILSHSYRECNQQAAPHTGELVLQHLADACVRHGISLVWAQRADGSSSARELSLGRLVLALLTSPPTRSQPAKKTA